MTKKVLIEVCDVPEGFRAGDVDTVSIWDSDGDRLFESMDARIIDNPAPAAQSDLLQYDSDLRYVQRVLEGEHPTRPDLLAARELVVKIRTCVRPAHTHAPSVQSGEAVPDAILSDGFGNYWARCGVGCEMEIVRPGKVQCDKCDNPRPANLTSAQPSVEGREARLVSYATDGATCTLNIRGEEVYFDRAPAAAPAESVPDAARAEKEESYPPYTSEIGSAGDAYIRSKALNGKHHLPANFLWYELWDAMNEAAKK